jgi:hypothetical protein
MYLSILSNNIQKSLKNQKKYKYKYNENKENIKIHLLESNILKEIPYMLNVII